MFTPGDEALSPTGTTLSPSSGPNGKNMCGTEGSVRLSTETIKRDRDNNVSSGIEVMSACEVFAELKRLVHSRKARVRDVKLLQAITSNFSCQLLMHDGGLNFIHVTQS